MNKSKPIIIYSMLTIVIIISIVIFTFGNSASSTSTKLPIKVVAAENFWGSLVSQIGGNKVVVKSVVSDPNADPHEYESSSSDAKAIAQANYVILNGAGYDSWANKLLAASPSSSRKVLTVANLLNKKEGDNPHFWYNPDYVNIVIKQMKDNLTQLDPNDASYFNQQYNNLVSALKPYQNRIASIKKQFGGTKVAATEDIFQYLATASGLNLISPESFMQAVAEGNDPPTNSVVEFQNQLTSNQPNILVYNAQTVTPLTDNIKKLAAAQGIPVIAVTETIQPPNTSFQDWMNAELINIENGLNSQALGN